jgi:hypothetical protein
MSLRPTFHAIREHHPSAGRLRLYARNVDVAIAHAGEDYLGFKLILDPTVPADRILVKDNKGELLSTVMLPGKA